MASTTWSPDVNERSSAEVVFFAALDQAGAERTAYLDEACAGNKTLRRRVETLLTAHAQVGHCRFLERPIAEAEGVAALSGVDSAAADLSFLASSAEPGAIGRLDHYEILEVVGRGAMGIVLRARDTKLERIVAIKVLAPVLAISTSARQRFVREARAAAAISHDNVIAIHAVEDDSPQPYLVMQFIDGPTLQAKLDRSGPLPPIEVLRIGLQIALGLAAAHRHGLIHRDIKPANILLENGIERVKITDFGLAHAAGEDSLTPSGFIAGTPAYMSPEQANGKRVDHRSDLYSLGSVLYALSTAQPPFRGRTTIEVLQAVREDTPRPARAVNRDVPAWLSELIARLHAKDPADRPTAAQEVADVLEERLMDLSEPHTLRFRATHEAGQSGQGIGGVTTTYPASPRARFGRRRWLWAAAAVLFLLVAGLGVSEATGVTKVRGTVIRLFSPQGTLVVEVDDPDVSVTVDGGDVVITGAGAKEIRLKPGQYKVEASKDGKVVRQELVTVTRNGRQVVRVSAESPPLTAAAWEKSVAALSGAELVEAVARRLKELNPGFDGRVTPSFEDGVVTGLFFLADDVADISPVRALVGLKSLDCPADSSHQSKLSDLSPLRGMKLTRLRLDGTRVSHLGDLRGMPLKELLISTTRVPELSPLRGMPLKVLAFEQTSVADLKALAGMKLEVLYFPHTHVTDLSPLRGMPLRHLHCAGTGVADLKPLEGMPLKELVIYETRVADLKPLKGMPLKFLYINQTRVADLAPLRGIALEKLFLSGTAVTDLAPLKGMPLTDLLLDFRAERDAEFLRSFKTLEKINGKSAVEFWKEVDGK
jgi:hypothetical protein